MQLFQCKWIETEFNQTRKIFSSKVNIWNVNCARAAAFIFDPRTDVLVKVSSLEIENYILCNNSTYRKGNRNHMRMVIVYILLKERHYS